MTMKKINQIVPVMHSTFKPGDVVRLVHAQGCAAKEGTLAVVVRPEDYPIYHRTMLNTIGEKDLFEYFLAIYWLPNIEIQQPAEDGFYSKARFEKVEKVAVG